MVDAWPADLPQCLNVGYSEGEGDGALEYPVEAGPPITRLRTSSVTRPLTGQMRMTRAQLASLREFVATTLIRGTLPFTFPDPTAVGGGTLLVMFGKGNKPSWQQIGGGVYRVNIQLTVLP